MCNLFRTSGRNASLAAAARIIRRIIIVTMSPI
jgi:hypothetical protein